jgi:hypothetical protein
MRGVSAVSRSFVGWGERLSIFDLEVALKVYVLVEMQQGDQTMMARSSSRSGIL